MDEVASWYEETTGMVPVLSLSPAKRGFEQKDGDDETT
jgi:hypothetical protein